MSSSNTAGAQLASIPELVAIILGHLNYFDLLRVRRVCKRWRDCVLSVKELQPLLYKNPVTLVGNPHFEARIKRSTALGSPNGAFFDWLYSEIESAEVDLSKAALDAFTAHSDDSVRRYLLGQTDNLRLTLDHHLRGLSAWPEPVKVYDCGNFRSLHKSFIYKNLHPILRFLEHVPFVSIQGRDDVICLTWTYREVEPPGEFWDQGADENEQYRFFQTVAALCAKLDDIHSAMKRSGLEKDLCIQPTASLFSVTFCLNDSDPWNWYSKPTGP